MYLGPILWVGRILDPVFIGDRWGSSLGAPLYLDLFGAHLYSYRPYVANAYLLGPSYLLGPFVICQGPFGPPVETLMVQLF